MVSREKGAQESIEIELEDSLALGRANLIQGGDQLRNINCYEYLRYIIRNVADADLKESSNPATQLLLNFKNGGDYKPTVAYGDMYTNFINLLEEACVNPAFSSPVLDAIVCLTFLNHNHALERAAEMTQSVLDEAQHTSHDVEKKVAEHLKQGKKVNKASPLSANSLFARLKPMAMALAVHHTKTEKDTGFVAGQVKKMAETGDHDFKPMSQTSMVSVKEYAYKKADKPYPIELRMGTQAQYHQGTARPNPIFEKWLSIQKGQSEKITHVYFNNLGRDYEGLSPKGRQERLFEGNLTEQLHTLEASHPNVAVITLPADKGLLDKKFFNDYRVTGTCREAYWNMLEIVTGTNTTTHIEDFFISDEIKKKLYGVNEGALDRVNELTQLKALLNNSFKKILGKDLDDTPITQSEFQAVYFHFIKYELTNFILEKLQPTTFNMSCKDGIDRGGASSAYFNLMKCIEDDGEFTKEEFDRALHAAPTIVKGRGMNHHSTLIWNALDNYIETNARQPEPKVLPGWMKDWRNKHTPQNTKRDFIQDLESYCSEKGKESNQTGFFLRTPERTQKRKLEAARKLIQFLKGDSSVEKFTDVEKQTLKSGRLEGIWKRIEQSGITLANLEESVAKPQSPRV